MYRCDNCESQDSHCQFNLVVPRAFRPHHSCASTPDPMAEQGPKQESTAVAMPETATTSEASIDVKDETNTASAASSPQLDLSNITSADLNKLRQELHASLRNEEAMLTKYMELLVQRKELAVRVETAEMEETITKLTTQQEKLNQKKLRMQLEGMYY